MRDDFAKKTAGIIARRVAMEQFAETPTASKGIIAWLNLAVREERMITRSKAWLILMVVATVLVPGTPVSAEDGEVLIDQAKALAGGITPNDGPGFPVTISR